VAGQRGHGCPQVVGAPFLYLIVYLSSAPKSYPQRRVPKSACQIPSNSSQNRSKRRRFPSKSDQKRAHFVMPILTFWGVTPLGASARADFALPKGKKGAFWRRKMASGKVIHNWTAVVDNAGPFGLRRTASVSRRSFTRHGEPGRAAAHERVYPTETHYPAGRALAGRAFGCTRRFGRATIPVAGSRRRLRGRHGGWAPGGPVRRLS